MIRHYHGYVPQLFVGLSDISSQFCFVSSGLSTSALHGDRSDTEKQTAGYGVTPIACLSAKPSHCVAAWICVFLEDIERIHFNGNILAFFLLTFHFYTEI